MKLRGALLLVTLVIGWPRLVCAQVLPPSPGVINAQSTGATDCTFNSTCFAANVPNTAGALIFQITGTATSLTITFEGCAFGCNNGANFFSINVMKLSTGVQATTTTSTGQYSFNNTGLLMVRARCTTYSMGAVNVSLTRGSEGSSVMKVAPFFSGTFTTGAVLYASATNVISGLADVVTGQVLASGGVGIAPAYTATPSVTSLTVKAGTGTGTAKASGVVCDTLAATCGCTSYTDTATQNTWNTITCTLPASTLATTGDEIRISINFRAAGNGDTKEVQAYWNGGTCGGTGATMCSTGTSLWGAGITSATNGNSIEAQVRIKKSTSGNTQDLFSVVRASTLFIGQQAQQATVTDSGTIPIVFGARDTTGNNATAQAPNPTMTILVYNQ